MREILFRGTSEWLDNWVYGSLVLDEDLDFVCILPRDIEENNTEELEDYDYPYISKIGTIDGQLIRVDKKTLGQYTGLTDKNGTKIFEGDIVRILYTDWTSKSENDTRTLDEYLRDIAKIGVVEWDRYYPQFHIHFMDKDNFGSLNYGLYGFIEVIGNIYDNPKLLEK